MCLPRDLWTEQQSEQMRMPRLTLAHDGSLAPQSAHKDKGCLDLLTLLTEDLLNILAGSVLVIFRLNLI